MALRYQELIQEDLNVGVDRVWVGAPGGGELRSTQLGIHTVGRGQVACEATWVPGAITAGSKASTTLAVPDATTGDFVLASHSKILTSDLRILGHISAAGTAKVVIQNPTAATITVASGTVRVVVFPFLGSAISEPVAEFTWVVGAPAPTEVDVQFTDASSGGTPPYTYSWDFGGGLGDTEEQNPLVTYGKGGGGNTQVFTVTLTITDQGALVDSVSHDVTVIFTGGGG